MDEFDYWRLCDDLSILQAALLIVGQDPSQNSYVENWEVDKRPLGYEAAKTAIVNALKRGDLEGTLIWEPEHDQNGNFVGDTNIVDLSNSIVPVKSLRGFLKKGESVVGSSSQKTLMIAIILIQKILFMPRN